MKIIVYCRGLLLPIGSVKRTLDRDRFVDVITKSTCTPWRDAPESRMTHTPLIIARCLLTCREALT